LKAKILAHLFLLEVKFSLTSSSSAYISRTGLLWVQLFSLKAEAFLKQQKPEDADTVLLAAQKVEDALRKVTSLPADTTTLLVQAQIDMALGRYQLCLNIFTSCIENNHFFFVKLSS